MQLMVMIEEIIAIVPRLRLRLMLMLMLVLMRGNVCGSKDPMALKVHEVVI